MLYSETEGSGKGLISDAIIEMLGKYAHKTQNSSELTAQFNSNHQNKIFISSLGLYYKTLSLRYKKGCCIGVIHQEQYTILKHG